MLAHRNERGTQNEGVDLALGHRRSVEDGDCSKRRFLGGKESRLDQPQFAEKTSCVGGAQHRPKSNIRHVALGAFVVGNALWRVRKIAGDVGGGLAHGHAEAAHQIGAVGLTKPEQPFLNEGEPLFDAPAQRGAVSGAFGLARTPCPVGRAGA